MITKEEFLKKTNENELFAVIETFIQRAKEKGYFNLDSLTEAGKSIMENTKEFILTDKEKGNVIKEMLRDYK
jgi:hypothetical protein